MNPNLFIIFIRVTSYYNNHINYPSNHRPFAKFLLVLDELCSFTPLEPSKSQSLELPLKDLPNGRHPAHSELFLQSHSSQDPYFAFQSISNIPLFTFQLLYSLHSSFPHIFRDIFLLIQGDLTLPL